MVNKPTFLPSKLLIALLLSLLVFAGEFFSLFDNMERRFLDLSFRIRGAESAHPDIAIVDIDDQSLLTFGAWPWPRSNHADFLRIVQEYHPKVIFLDFLFTEAASEEGDRNLEEAIKANGNVVLPYYFVGSSPADYSEKTAVFPLPRFRENALDVGFVNIVPDRDGHVREFYPKVQDYKHASLAIVGHDSSSESWPALLINFPGPYEVFKRISFDRLVQDYENPEVRAFLHSIEGKIVLVGHTAAGTSMDLKPTAFSPQYPGIGLQASMIHTFLTQKFITKLPKSYHLLLLLLFSLLILKCASALKPAKGLFYAVASLTVFFEITQLVFKHLLLWIPYFSFLLLGIALFGIAMLLEYIKIRVEREIFSRELELGSRIQRSFLPAKIPKIPGLEIEAVSLPARHVGGDFYDILPLSEEKWGICIGDVSGKGIPAALFMAKTISEFRREADSEDPASCLKHLNDKIVHEGSGGLFVTLLYMTIEPKTRKISFSNGGHEPILLYQNKSQSVVALSTRGGRPLGIDSEAQYENVEKFLGKGDIVFLQTDGVREAMNGRHETFGMERMKSLILSLASPRSSVMTDRILKEIQGFVGNTLQHDDLTFVGIKVS